jgi:hypothetical protein
MYPDWAEATAPEMNEYATAARVITNNFLNIERSFSIRPEPKRIVPDNSLARSIFPLN